MANNAVSVAVAAAVTASSAYTTAYMVGGLLTFPVAKGSGRILNAQVLCNSVQTATYNLLLFTANPTATTTTDKTALTINAADLSKALCVIHLTDVTSTGLGGITINETTADVAKAFSGTTTLYGLLVVAGTPTYTATTDVTVVLGVIPD